MKKPFRGQQNLAGWLRPTLRPVQRKRGFAEARILNEWQTIVGPTLAARCIPQKLSFPKGQGGATLSILTDSAWALELQFQQQVICDKIAAFFGYRAVEQIRIQQGVLPDSFSSKRSREIPVCPQEDARIQSQVKDVEDDALRAALHRLGLSRHGAEKLETDGDIDHMYEPK